MQNFKRVFLAVIMSLLIPFAAAKADTEQKTIHLEVKTSAAVLYDADITVSACENTPLSSVYTVNAWCAVQQASATQGWTASSTWGAYGVFLNSINQYDGADGNWWLWYTNLEPGATALNAYELTDGENLLLTYGTSPLKISVSDSSPIINTTSTVTTWYFDAIAWQWNKVAEATIVVNENEYPSPNGDYEIFTNTATPYIVFAKKIGYLDSVTSSINAVLPSTTIKLQLETASSTIFNQNINVSACETSPNSGLYTLNGRCALEQANTNNSWSWWGDDAFLNSVNENVNDYVNNIYWGWFENLNYGQVALNKHILSTDEQLLLVYNTNPLKISAAATGTVGAAVTITLEQFGLDASWNPVWRPATSSTVIVNSQEFSAPGGTYELLLATTTPYTIYGKKIGYLDSDQIIIIGYEQMNEDGNNSNNNNSGGGGYVPPNVNNLDVDRAINFLANQQNVDGSFGSVLYSDWAAVALSAYGQENSAKDKIKQYLQTDPIAITGLNEVSDYARRAMALMSLNINPYIGTATNYIQKLTNKFDGQQFGDSNLYNDDIFALFPLLEAGYSYSDPMIANTTKFIISKQSANGDWGSVDLTAAAIQALVQTKNVEGANAALTKGKEFLQSQQQADGGFGNVFSTSWAMQAIAALGENQTLWLKNNKTPGDYLYSLQSSDGGLDNSAPVSSRFWSTAYAIPAALGKPWEQIINSFVKSITDNNSRGTNSDTNTSTVSPTLPLVQTTSTLPAIQTTSTIGSNNIDQITAIGFVLAEETPSVERSLAAAPSPLSHYAVRSSKNLSDVALSESSETAAINNAPEEGELSIAPAPNLSSPEDPLLPMKKKVAAGATTGSAVVFAGASLLLILRLLLAAL